LNKIIAYKRIAWQLCNRIHEKGILRNKVIENLYTISRKLASFDVFSKDISSHLSRMMYHFVARVTLRKRIGFQPRSNRTRMHFKSLGEQLIRRNLPFRNLQQELIKWFRSLHKNKTFTRYKKKAKHFLSIHFWNDFNSFTDIRYQVRLRGIGGLEFLNRELSLFRE